MDGKSYCVRLSNVSKSFQTARGKLFAIKELSSTIGYGIITGVVGPDGSGKSTLLRLLSGMYVPDSGQIEVLGLSPIEHKEALSAQLGYMPQNFGLYEDLTVEENLRLHADLYCLPKNEREKRFRELLAMSGLSQFMKRLAGSLSGGMKQKLALSSVLLSSPKLLLLDEPTVGVDPLSRRELWKILFDLVKDRGLSVLISTSYLEEARYCHDILLLDKGEKLVQGSPSYLEENAKGIVLLIHSEKMDSKELLLNVSSDPSVIDHSFEGKYIRILLQKDKKDTFLKENEKFGIVAIPGERKIADCVLSFYPQKQQPALSSSKEEVALKEKRKERSLEKIIVVEKLSRFFGKFEAVKKISFSVNLGEIFGILGPNGAGKSTTFRMLCGLLPPSEGKVSVSGFDLRTSPASARSRIGYVSQKFSLYTNLSVYQNLLFFSRAYDLSGEKQKRRIASVIEEYELGSVLDMDAGRIPLGFQKRLAIACATLHDPDILFLDEPTSGMDPQSRREFWIRMIRLSRRHTTLLITTHYLEEAEYCDRLVIISRGKILIEGSPQEIKKPFQTEDNPTPTIEDAFIGLIEKSREEN
ncbi:ABC transporter ATP-binding protein [Candidatus Methylacidiphilum fumarolicum]|uniref:ABC exporter ATP binding subunit n=2 Tax=Candidatus Methylacidiphilum fumarolicum TaxID=591154 RepID=A0ABM9IEK0_9BACT|nr:ATP-binding cassette domain-containing protein [Candidatus Methylacidiphilum fumarolicum]MBW6414292.1 ATP-binding cassette domain-containing protein [Candidatus Methylacidiphilum fumarolicum]TFE67091.1 ABC transporter ATP-binding protein [Candidatus Methylacidiphilum fumarolicum]TFE72100.1 ABC transporter ATP-binding protein [Candidatus Methylacidiphilum fumarolicum]TFE74078.1 ABC transporter ATP-binding protein [Candidatus Methylacidiphilum fumarolicum]TFE76346.1 ABC transporter ATP-bindin